MYRLTPTVDTAVLKMIADRLEFRGTDDGYVLKLDKSDFGRQLAGLVYTLDITLRREGERVTVTVDDGDLRNQLLASGETLDLEETWKNATLPPGNYVARATLTSANFPMVRETAFAISGTTIASR